MTDRVISNIDIGPERYGETGETLTTSGTSTSSGAFLCDFIDVQTTQAAYIKIASGTVTATSAGYVILPGILYTLPITSGNKVAALQVTAAGSVYIHPVGF